MHTQQLIRIFLHFLKLGCLSFGGPAAHLVFFHRHFVQQLRWLSDAEYAQLVALAQLLPGPTSSQVGIAIGYQLQGYRGAWRGLARFYFAVYAPHGMFRGTGSAVFQSTQCDDTT